MKRIIKIICVLFVLIISSISFLQVNAESYISYTYDIYGDEVPSPIAYYSEIVNYNIKYNNKSLSFPEDMYVSKDKKIYICDTGNNRIVILNEDYSYYKEIVAIKAGQEILTLNKPQGIFVTKNNIIYICDTGNNRILIVDEDGNEVKKPLLRPVTTLIADNVDFQPKKIIVDSTDSAYVVAYGIYQGLLTYSPEGDFTGFFGSNRVELSAGDQFMLFWKGLFTQEQRDAMERFIPVEYSNVYIDSENYIYTSTRRTDSSCDELKKLNALGENVLRYPTSNTYYPANDFGDLSKTIENKQKVDSRFEDIHVDEDGIVSGLDTERAKVFQYDQDCNLLFVFGGNGNQSGLFSEPVALEKINDNYIVLDKSNGTITVFKPSEYSENVIKMSMLYNDGMYTESQQYCEEILKQNGYYSLAYKCIGKSLLQQGKYKEAMEYFKKGGDREGYSEAFGEVRKQHIRAYLIYYLPGGVIIICIVIRAMKLILCKIGVLPPKRKKVSS